MATEIHPQFYFLSPLAMGQIIIDLFGSDNYESVRG